MSPTSSSRELGLSGRSPLAASFAQLCADEEASDADWDDFDLDPTTDDVREPSDLEEDEEPLPEYGDFWPEQDDLED